IIPAELKDHGDYSWYHSREIDNMPRDFRLVLADGPPGYTKGGRYGLLPIMRSHLSPDVVILLDDAERKRAQIVLGRWQKEYDLHYLLHVGEVKGWAICTFSPPLDST
ncbi:MAG: hypothetical protein ACRD43_02205, partial [Pyrinomonadaceae bacterium]